MNRTKTQSDLYKKYSKDLRYNADSNDLSQERYNRYSLRNRAGFYFKYRKFSEAVNLFNYEKVNFKNMKILDIGCHRGYQLNHLAFLKGTSNGLYGIDIIPSFIKNAKSINPSINFKVMDVYNLRFKDAYFDLIWLFSILGEIRNEKERANVVNNISKKVKKGGYIIIFDFYQSLGSRITRRFCKIINKKKGKNRTFFNDKIIQKLFPEFKIVKSKTLLNIATFILCKYFSYPIVGMLDCFIPNEYYMVLLKKVKENE